MDSNRNGGYQPPLVPCGKIRGGTSDKVLDLHSLKSWAVLTWHLKRKLRMALMGGSLILFQFEKVVEKDKVLHLGWRYYKEKHLHLERWAPESRWFRNAFCA